MADILAYFGVGGIGLILLSVLIEITPIKINPIQWFGNRLNKTSIDCSKRTEKKLDEHIAQSYRNKILSFQESLTMGARFTSEAWSEILEACDAYEKHVEDNGLKNGKADLAINFIKSQYSKCLAKGSFLNISSDGGIKR